MIDFEHLRKLYEFDEELDFSEIQKLISLAKHKVFEPLDVFIQQGTKSKEMFFITKGLVRSYTIKDNGDEVTTSLWCENQVFSSPYGILYNKPAKYTFEAMERTETLSISYDDLQKALEQNPIIERNRRFILYSIIGETLGRLESFVLLSPEERYLKFIEKNKNIINRVADKHIAQVIGITPVSLSRIRKRIATKK